MKLKKIIWPFLGIIVTILSIRALYAEFTNPKNELSKLSFNEFWLRLSGLEFHHWALALFFTLLAYSALTGYDQIALKHLKKKIAWPFIAICAFTTYSLSHSIGASVFSGAAVRYRAYSIKGLSASEVAILVAFCTFTFMLGVFLLFAVVLFIEPNLFIPLLPIFHNIFSIELSPENLRYFAFGLASFFTLFIAFYILGSWMQFKPLKIGKKIQINYPNLKIVILQLIIGPLEIIGAAGIIYAAFPDDVNVSFIVVLGAFLVSFSIGLLSNAPGGGLGILEILFISLVPEINPADVLVALIVFRLLYLIIPLLISLIIVANFEVFEFRKKKQSQEQKLDTPT